MREDNRTTTPHDAERWQRNHAPDTSGDDVPSLADLIDTNVRPGEEPTTTPGEPPAAFLVAVERARPLLAQRLAEQTGRVA